MNPLLLLPEMLLFGGGLGVLIGGSFLPRRRLWITRAAAATALVAAIAVAAVALAGPGGEAFEGTFRVDTTTGVARIVAAFAMLLVLALASDEIAGSPRESETYALALFATTGTRSAGRRQRSAGLGPGVPAGQHSDLRADRSGAHLDGRGGDHEGLPVGRAVRNRSATGHHAGLWRGGQHPVRRSRHPIGRGGAGRGRRGRVRDPVRPDVRGRRHPRALLGARRRPGCERDRRGFPDDRSQDRRPAGGLPVGARPPGDAELAAADRRPGGGQHDVGQPRRLLAEGPAPAAGLVDGGAGRVSCWYPSSRRAAPSWRSRPC